MIMEIGAFEGYRVQKEVSLIDEFQVDVCWWKKPGKNPKYAFEVIVGSSVTNPLSSLKTALDEWNCNKIIVIAEGEKLRKTRVLLDTTFSEMAPFCNVIESSKIKELRAITAKYHRIKSAIGYTTFPL